MRLLSVMRMTVCIMGLLAMKVTPCVAQAENALGKLRYFYQHSKTVGITYQLEGQNLAVFVKTQTLLNSISALQKAVYINLQMNNTQADAYEPILAANLSINYVTSIVKAIYLRHDNLDLAHVNVYLFLPDRYGNNQKTFCYAFDFNRALYQKINWANFDANNIKFIAPNFKTSPVCEDLVTSMMVN